VGSSIRVYAVTVFCCGVYSSDVQCFSMDKQLPKTASLRGDLDPHLIHGSLGPLESPPNGISRLNQFVCFCTAHECDHWPTDTHRERPRYSFCGNRPHLCYACDATQKQRKKPCSGKLGIGPDHPCCGIKIKFCIEVVFRGSSIVSKCHQIG